MLTTLKDIFRPTWKRLAWTITLGFPITMLGVFVAGKGAVHSVPLIIVGSVCLFPHVLFWWFAETRLHIIAPSYFKWAILPILQFFYFYVPVCLIGSAIGELRRRLHI